MTIYQHAYATTVGEGTVMTRVKHSLEEAILKSDFAHRNAQYMGGRLPVEGTVIPTVLTQQDPAEENAEVFAHPLLLKMPSVGTRKDVTYMVSDARYALYKGPLKEGFIHPDESRFPVKNKTEFDFVRVRTLLSAFWATGNYNDFRYMPRTLMAVYASWISENLSRRFALDPKDQQSISVLAAMYYQTLFKEESEFSDADKQRLAGQIAQVTYAKAENVFRIFDQIQPMKTLGDFCENIKTVLDNPRVAEINPGLIVSVVSGSWFGSNAREIAGIAIDHPPTWMTLVYSAFADRSYKNSPLAKIAERFKGSKGEVELMRALKALVDKSTYQ